MSAYYLALVPLLFGGALWRYNAADPPPLDAYARLCPCFAGWTPLDIRWRHLRDTAEQLCDSLSWFTFGAVSAAVADLLGWFIGRSHLRIPFDEVFLDQLIENSSRYGCALGAGALVDVALADGSPEKWCPTRARQGCRAFFVGDPPASEFEDGHRP